MASLGIKHRCYGLMVTLGLALPALAQASCHLREGDLLFACSETDNAITAVTSGIDRLPIDHVAIVHRIGGDAGQLCVIEAVKPMVSITPIDDFLSANPLLMVGRVNVDVDVDESIGRCLLMVGKPYDDIYMPGDSALYCSELVQLNYVDHDGALIFEPVPMSFHDSTGQVIDYWKEFYANRGMSVPEGAPGSNPGELSRRRQVSIIGTISGGNFHNYLKNTPVGDDNCKKTEN